ncbi:MAG: polysaccharide biosynthesis protein [bacterium]|nr:polysaccharide biosynthesis protein [bacterium]
MNGTDLQQLRRRESISVGSKTCRAAVGERRVLVTGAGGSIGSVLARRVLDVEPEGLVLLDGSEQNLHDLALSLADHPSAGRSTYVLGDAGDVGLIDDLVQRHRPQLVYHAAAHKHAPLLESQPLAAIDNNTLTTVRLLEVCAGRIDRLVMISTDKAVNPCSLMGASKRLAELVLLQADSPVATSLRLGNVWGSRGSVVPHFEWCLDQGRPLTVTHANATRYFMTEDEAAELTLAAPVLGDGADILVPDLGRPLSILEIARTMVAERGLSAESYVRIAKLRPGDKVTEELHRAGERLQPSGHSGVGRIVGPIPNSEEVLAWVEELADAVARRDVSDLIERVRAILPEYAPGPEVLELPETRRGRASKP